MPDTRLAGARCRALPGGAARWRLEPATIRCCSPGPGPACLRAAPQEKKKRDKGQVSRGTNYVEEEKRLARQFNQYSGFD